MSTFADNVYEIFEGLCNKYSFVPARALADELFAPLVKKLTDDNYAYIFVHDGRPGDAELVVWLWIAPPHRPDDGLDKLGVGYKVLIARAYDIDDDFFHMCEERIVNLIPAFRELSNAVTQELSRQRYSSKRRTVYEHERQAFDSVKKRAISNGDAACAKALEVARDVAQGKRSLRVLEKASVSAAKSLLSNHALSAEAERFYDGNADFLGSCIVGLLYVDALGSGPKIVKY